ncbi:branched-chain amino acid ABC transporter substrate-binding protein [Leucobacter sp. CSA2]|uniref:Branched-chain amino acid ABC transporter substrate-binding protein n=1 Tax=Leucobacter edaphi TaxID=2796472 RepID=A0A934Q9Q2_9MICO|nr:branched-chain amino acid ABC transporter substrate-binding protein [Leucobacter edaphi]MBK0420749.1 branched-chain amino acid ABC transporter substrate-binding protein [Leucobacter edaphi]
MYSRHTHRGRRIAAVGAIVLSAGLVLSGCSGGLASGDKGGSEEGPIKLGMLAPFSGSEAAFGDYMKNGATMAVNEINKDGGVDGRKLELVVEDDACDATASVAAAQKLVTAGVVASVGGYCSGATLPTLPIFKEASIPMVIPAANSNALVGQGAFLINGTGAQQAGATVKYAEKLGSKKVAVVDDNTDYSKDLAKSVQSQAKESGKVEIVKTDSVNPDEKDFAANVNNVLGSKPDLIVWTGYYQAGGLLIRQFRDAGYDGTILVGDGSVDAQLSAIAGAENVKNVVGTFTQTPDMLEGADTWIKDYKTEFKADPGPYSTQSYDAVRVVAEAMKNAKSTDGKKVDEALAGLKDFKLFSGPATFTKDGTLEGSGGFVIVEPTGAGGSFVMKDNLQG